MANQFTSVKITGVEDLRRKLDALPEKLAKKLERSSVRVAAKVFMAAVKAATPVLTGAGQSSWKVRAIKRSRRFPGRIGVQVVSSKEAHAFKGKTFYMAFLEFGTNERFHKSGKSTGAIAPPLGFVKRAATQSQAAVSAAFRNDLQGRIAALAKTP